jgi:hypothetical protein
VVTPGLLEILGLEGIIDGSAFDIKRTRPVTTLVGGFRPFATYLPRGVEIRVRLSAAREGLVI